MKFFDPTLLKLEINNIRKYKLRNIWTMLGVIIGVASVILVVAISEGVKQQINTKFMLAGNDVISVQPKAIKVSGSSYDSLSLLSGLSLSGSLNTKDVDAVANTEGVYKYAPLSAMSANVRGNRSAYSSGLVIGTNNNLMNILGQSMKYGNFLNPNDGSNQGVVLGYQAAIELFSDDVPLGNALYINGNQYFVRGVIKPIASTPLSSGAEYNRSVFIDYYNAQGLTNGTITTYQILAKPYKKSQITKVTNRINHNLMGVHGNQQLFEVNNSNDPNSSSSAILNLMTRSIIGIAIISLIVGGIGIMNVMLVSITERMHEIGIRKAIGATNKQIRTQFLVESTVLSGVGGIIGILLAYFVDLLLRMFTNLRPVISLEIVAISFIASVLIGMVFGTFPALKAASKQPIEALRSE